jgi:signal transduction histidine kinase
MSSQTRPFVSESKVSTLLGRALRLKWAAFSAVVIFAAVYWVDAWLVHHGLRRDVTLLDDLLLSALVFALVIAQQLRHERELERQRQLMKIVADMNHHIRNALQVIVSRSVLSMADSAAVDDIRQAVRRIDWCLREVLPNAGESPTRKPPLAEPVPQNAARSHRSGR